MTVTSAKPWLPMAALTLLFCPLSAGAGAAEPSYYNDRFEFGIDTPDGMTACSDGASSHGFYIPLTPSGSCKVSGDASLPARMISLIGSYNLSSLTRLGFPFTSARQLAARECVSVNSDVNGRWRPWNDVTTFLGRPAAGCRIDYPDGRIEFSLSILHRRNAEEAGDWAKLTYNVITDPAHVEVDLATFRRLMSRITLRPEVGFFSGRTAPKAIYRDPFMGFALIDMKRSPFCVAAFEEEGLEVLLDRHAPCTDEIDAEFSTRRVSLFGVYELYDLPLHAPLREVAHAVCRAESDAFGGRWQSLDGLGEIAGRPTVGCRIDLADGGVVIRSIIFSDEGTILAYDLTTDSEHLAADLASARALASHLRLGPEQHK